MAAVANEEPHTKYMMPCAPTGWSMSNPASRGIALIPDIPPTNQEEETGPVTSISSDNQLMPLAKIIEMKKPKPPIAT